jgi:hypothetical protein
MGGKLRATLLPLGKFPEHVQRCHKRSTYRPLRNYLFYTSPLVHLEAFMKWNESVRRTEKDTLYREAIPSKFALWTESPKHSRICPNQFSRQIVYFPQIFPQIVSQTATNYTIRLGLLLQTFLKERSRKQPVYLPYRKSRHLITISSPGRGRSISLDSGQIYARGIRTDPLQPLTQYS